MASRMELSITKYLNVGLTSGLGRSTYLSREVSSKRETTVDGPHGAGNEPFKTQEIRLGKLIACHSQILVSTTLLKSDKYEGKMGISSHMMMLLISASEIFHILVLLNQRYLSSNIRTPTKLTTRYTCILFK